MSTTRIEAEPKGICLYHVVRRSEGFDESARTLFELVQRAAEKFPGRKRYLFLDIDGHRNPVGGYDAEMFELQNEFILGFLGKYLTEITTPMYKARPENQQQQEPPEGELDLSGEEEA